MATRSKIKAATRKANADNRPNATAKFVRISPFKVRIVLDIIKGKSVNEAVAILENTPKAASPIVLKLLNSAIANAENNQNLSRNDLVVAECFANDGPSLKRMRARAKGRGMRILKRTCHITVILDSVNA